MGCINLLRPDDRLSVWLQPARRDWVRHQRVSTDAVVGIQWGVRVERRSASAQWPNRRPEAGRRI